MRANTFRMMMVSGMCMLITGLLSAQESSARFFRILATNQITITSFTDGVMGWEGQSAGAAVTVEASDNLTDTNGWRRYTEVPGDDSRGSLNVFDNTTPAGMVLIPCGRNSGTDPDDGAYSLTVDAFYMDATEVTKVQWGTVYSWAVTNGYSFANAGSGKAANHPVQTVSWYDCVKWCNARSEKDGRTPCYTVSSSTYKTGESAPDCDFEANGYRLPTNDEWEYAARGGLSGKRFPWGDTITHREANYYSYWSGGVPYYSYDVNPTSGYHPAYATGGTPYTSPAGSFSANGYGLYDMSGNVWEWCNDSSGSGRPLRGGSWTHNAYPARCGYEYASNPSSEDYGFGFRSVCR